MKSQKLYLGNSAQTSGAGFTLIEVLIVIALTSIVLSMGMIIGQSSIGRSYALNERDTLVSFLTTARAQSLANINESAHGVHITATSTTLFEGQSYTLRNKALDKISPRTPNISVIAPSLYTVPYSIIFSQLGGDVTTGSGTTTITDGASSSTIIISSGGRINW